MGWSPEGRLVIGCMITEEFLLLESYLNEKYQKTCNIFNCLENYTVSVFDDEFQKLKIGFIPRYGGADIDSCSFYISIPITENCGPYIGDGITIEYFEDIIKDLTEWYRLLEILNIPRCLPKIIALPDFV